MKVQIVRKDQEAIVGYEVVKVESPNSLEISHLVDNSCENIIAADLVDSFNNEILPQLCKALVSKLRFNGQIVLGGTDVRFFAKHLLNGILSAEEACGIIASTYSMSTSDMVRQQLENVNLRIISIHTDGLHYEVKAVRV